MANEESSDQWEIVDEEGAWAMGADDDTEEGRPLPGPDADLDSIKKGRENETDEERNVRKVEETRFDQRRTLFDVDAMRAPPPGRDPHDENSKRIPSDGGSRKGE